MYLKALRTRLGITQQKMATELSTSQQTIARWETGRYPIPTKYLKDLAVFLGCSIPELLGADSKGRFEDEKKKKGLTESINENNTLYGKAGVCFGRKGEDTHEWPVSEGQRISILHQINHLNENESKLSDWLTFTTLNDRVVFVNANVLESITLESDDATVAPAFAHEEVYRIVSDLIYNDRPTQQELDQVDSPYSRQLLDTCENMITEWGGDDGAYNHMGKVYVERSDGSQDYLNVEDDGVSDLVITLWDGTSEYRFANLESEGWHKASFHRLEAIRLIEMSLIKWTKMLSDDDE